MDESDTRRKSLLSAMARLASRTQVFAAKGKDQTNSRDLTLQHMVPILREQGVNRLVPDSREGQDKRDRTTIHRLVGSDPQPAFGYTPLPSSDEPLLWVPDATA